MYEGQEELFLEVFLLIEPLAGAIIKDAKEAELFLKEKSKPNDTWDIEREALQLVLAKIILDRNFRDLIEYVEIKKGKKDVSIT